MDLKELLGEELFNQVTTKLGENKIAIVSDGNWIPKDKFNAVNDQVKEMKTQITERDKQLKELGEKAKGNEELLKQITDLQEQNKTTKEEYESKIKKQAFDFAIESALSQAEAKKVKAVRALLDESKIKLNDDKLEGLEEQIKALKESDSYLFGKDTVKGKPPAGNGGSAPTKNPWSKEHYNLTEQGKILRENPTLAAQLMAAAK